MTPVQAAETDVSDRATRSAFLLRRILPALGIVLLLVLVWAVLTLAWLRTALLILAAVIAVGAVYGWMYQTRAARRDRKKYPPSGTLVDAGGYRLHLDIRGQDTGKPAVVLESGMVGFAANWHWVSSELAGETQVVAYDRAGFGWSEVSPNPRDAQQIAHELHTALQNANIPGPYVLAGHSFGGIPIRAFADLYPDEVAGLVSVDGSHPDQWDHMPVANADRLLAASMAVQSVLFRFGVSRLMMRGAVKMLTDGLPDPIPQAFLAWISLPQTPVVERQQIRAWRA